MGILCLLGMAGPSLDKLEIMWAEKVPTRQAQSMLLPRLPAQES